MILGSGRTGVTLATGRSSLQRGGCLGDNLFGVRGCGRWGFVIISGSSLTATPPHSLTLVGHSNLSNSLQLLPWLSVVRHTDWTSPSSPRLSPRFFKAWQFNNLLNFLSGIPFFHQVALRSSSILVCFLVQAVVWLTWGALQVPLPTTYSLLDIISKIIFRSRVPTDSLLADTSASSPLADPLLYSPLSRIHYYTVPSRGSTSIQSPLADPLLYSPLSRTHFQLIFSCRRDST